MSALKQINETAAASIAAATITLTDIFNNNILLFGLSIFLRRNKRLSDFIKNFLTHLKEHYVPANKTKINNGMLLEKKKKK